MADDAAQAVPEYVGFWKRFLAFIIDSVIILAVIFIAALAVYGRQYMELSGQGKTLLFDILVQGVLPALAAILFWRYRGATPGKMLIGAKIVNAKTLGKPSMGQLIGRYFAYIVSTLPGMVIAVAIIVGSILSARMDLNLWLLVTPLLMWGFVWIAFDKRKQGWHDKLAGTLVIRDEED
jgi:uncharacterized RDD family membrane protein YckC